MPAPKGGRRQRRMPNLNLSRQQLHQSKSQTDPTSPPHTPTASPQKTRKSQPAFGQPSRAGPMDPRIQPVGNGHQFSYQPFIGPEQLSPRSPSSSEAADDSDGDEHPSEEEEYQHGPIKAPSPLAVSDAQSSSGDDSNSDEDGDYEEGDDEDEEEDAEPVQDSELHNGATKSTISPVGRTVQMEDVEEEEDDDDEDDEEEEEEEDDELVQDLELNHDAAMPSISPFGRTVHMEDVEEEEEDEEEYDDDDENDDGDDEDEDEEEEEEEEEEDSDANGDGMSRPTMESPVHAAVITSTTTIGDFVLEDMDPMDSDNGLSIQDPYEIESNRSRSSSKHRDDNAPKFEHRELPIRMMQDLKNLNCSHEASDEEAEAGAEQETEEAAFYKWQQHMRRRRLSISSSITGKRTFSERSESDDSDDAGLDVNEVGSSARRMRKRMHRGSLLFQDPPEPRIDELEEPNSSEDEYLTTQQFGMELPYWTIEINEMEESQ